MSKLKELLDNINSSLAIAIKTEQEEMAKGINDNWDKGIKCNWYYMGHGGAAFMRRVFEIGQAIEMGQIERENTQLGQTLREVSSKLILISQSIGMGIESVENFVDDPGELPYESLEKACFYRSSIEFFNDLFPNPANGDPEWEPIDYEDLEDSIIHRASYIGSVDSEQIPPGIPSSHWWWWTEGERPE